MKLEKGIIQVYDGKGKGKTTAAFGLALRAAGRGLRTHVIQFLKCSNRYGELRTSEKLKPLINVTMTGKPCRSDDGSPDFVCTGCMKCHVDPNDPSPDDYEWAKRGLELAEKSSRDGSCDLLVLDELNYAVSFGLVRPSVVVELLKNKSSEVEIVITGRSTAPEILDEADLVTTVRELKHHYMKGLAEVEGIDY